MPWALDCGVLHAGSDGLAVRPQMKMGWATNHYHLQLGVDDLRDGLSAAAVAQVHRTYKAEGNSLVDVRSLHRSLLLCGLSYQLCLRAVALRAPRALQLSRFI